MKRDNKLVNFCAAVAGDGDGFCKTVNRSLSTALPHGDREVGLTLTLHDSSKVCDIRFLGTPRMASYESARKPPCPARWRALTCLESPGILRRVERAKHRPSELVGLRFGPKQVGCYLEACLTRSKSRLGSSQHCHSPFQRRRQRAITSDRA